MRGTYTPVDKDVDPDLPVEKGVFDILPFELVCLGDLGVGGIEALALVFETVDYESPFFFC